LEHRAKIAIAAVAGAVAVLTAGAYAYDSSRDDLVMQGVRVAGVDVGGLHAGRARQVIQGRLAARLERPAVLVVAGRRFRLTPERANIRADLDGMVSEAVDRSRSGALPARVWRGLTGKRVDSDLPALVTYSPEAVKAFVLRVRRAVNRPPRDASVKFGAASLPAVPSQTGLRVSRTRLRAAVETALSGVGGGRRVRARVHVKRPKVTTAELAKHYPYVITVDRPAFKLRFFKRLKLKKAYPIAVGRIGLETPAGLYHIQDKVINPSWHVPNSAWAGDLAGKVIPPGPDDPLKARWMGIFAGAGIHGTDDIGSLGSAASHGCIRMSIPDVEELYDQVPVRTPVYIQ
jgi:hypothetical protein